MPVCRTYIPRVFLMKSILIAGMFLLLTVFAPVARGESAVLEHPSPDEPALVVDSDSKTTPDLPPFLPQGNEQLDYEVGFLWFDRLADGSLSFERLDVPGSYRAVLEVRTRGMAALFTRNRRERYESYLNFGDDGYFHSRSFIARRFTGSGKSLKDRGKALFFSPDEGTVLYQHSEKGKLTSEKRLELPENHEVFDFLCAYWNLRLGMFGPLIPGTSMVLPSYSFKGASDIVLEVLSSQDQEDLKYFPKGGILCRMYLDEELFDTGGGKLFVWFNESRQPGKGIVADVLGLGDVRGTMIDAKEFQAPPVSVEIMERPIHVESAPFSKE